MTEAPEGTPGPAAGGRGQEERSEVLRRLGITDKVRSAGVVSVRHPGRWISTAVIAVLIAMLVHTVIANPRFRWNVVWEYFGYHQLIAGLGMTLELTAITMAIGLVLGTLLAMARMSPNPVLSSVSWVYVWFFRGIPLLVQLIIWYNLASLYPQLSIGIPFGPEFAHGSANKIITAFGAAVIGLGLDQAAYVSEIIRSGIMSVDEGQREAASALGLSGLQAFRKVVFPQALRVIIPPVGNQLIGLLKYTSLVSVLSLPELLYSAQLVYAQNFLTIPILFAATIWYLIVTTILMIGQYYVERYFARGSARNLPPTPIQRIRASLARWRIIAPAGEGSAS
jgi:polar amino acid transport system permease protein